MGYCELCGGTSLPQGTRRLHNGHYKEKTLWTLCNPL